MRITRRYWYGLVVAAVTLPLGAASVASHAPRATGAPATPGRLVVGTVPAQALAARTPPALRRHGAHPPPPDLTPEPH